jgi:phage baseplate assembly protein V
MHHDPAVPETARLLMNSVAFGIVMSLDLSDATQPRAVVNVNSLQSAPMPWLARRAGPDAEWWAPEVGEQVAVICAYGDTVQGIILGSTYQANFPAPSTDPNVWQKLFKDGTFIQYDRNAHALTVDVTKSEGTVTINCQAATVNASENVTLNTPTTHLTGDLQVDGNTTVNGDTEMKGNADVQGDTTVKNITSNGTDISSTHYHGNGNQGNPTTPPIG